MLGSWFYKWHEREPTPRDRRHETLDTRVGAIFANSGGNPKTHGSPRIHAALAERWREAGTTADAA